MNKIINKDIKEINTEIDFDLSCIDVGIGLDSNFEQNEEIENNIEKSQARSCKIKSNHMYKRAYSEIQLFDILGIERLEKNTTYHCISGGDVDSLSYIKYILRQQNLKYLLFSTWCMALEDILEIEKWLYEKKIIRLDAYVGEIFPNSYIDQYEKLCNVIKKTKGRVCVARNHSKIYAGEGEKYKFAIESSANINTNPRIENTAIIINDDAYYFYKNFFDGLKSFNKGFELWKRY